MAAKSRDAQAGWRIYRESAFTLTMEEINQRLERLGFTPIAPRTYTHYRKLHRYGYERYVPINQLDVETLRDAVWEGPLRSRYRPRPTELAVQLLVVVDGLVTLAGEAIEISPVEAVVRFRSDRALELLRGDWLEGHHGLLYFESIDDTKSVVVELIEPDVEGGYADVTMEFLGLVSASELLGRKVLDAADARLTFRVSEADSPLFVLRDLYAFFEALDASRVVCDEVLAALDPEGEHLLPTAQIRQLSLESPLLVVVYAAAVPLMLLLVLMLRYEKVRLAHFEANEKASDAEIKSEQARAIRIRNDQAQFRVDIEHAVVVNYIESTLKTALLEKGDTPVALPPEVIERAKDLVDRQLLPSVERLMSPEVEGISFDTDLPLPPLPDEPDGTS